MPDELLRRPDARQQHDLRRADRTGREDHFAAAARQEAFVALPPTHANGTLALEHDAFNQAAGFQPQVRPLEHRLEERSRGRPAPAALLVHMKGADAFVVAGVEVRNGFDVRLFGRGAEGIEQIPAHARLLHRQFTSDSVQIAFAKEMIFVLFEVGQHVVPAPAGQSKLSPMIVVGGLPAHVDHGVDSGRAADHLAARIAEAAAVEAFLRFGFEAPIRTRIADRKQITDGDMKPDPVIAAACLKHEYATIRIGREPVGKQATRRPRADDDVVIFAVDRRCLGHICIPHNHRTPCNRGSIRNAWRSARARYVT